jgi:multidrug efflux pump subunit AcrB
MAFRIISLCRHRSIELPQLDNTPLTSALDINGTPIPNVLGSIATGQRAGIQSVFNQSNIQAVYDVWGSVQNSDLGSVAAEIQEIVEEVEPQLKPGNHIVIRGEIESMQSAFWNLKVGLLFAAVFVYMLDGRQLSKLRRSVCRHPGAAGCWGRHSVDAVRHRHDAERAVGDGRDHGDRRSLGELDIACHIRA